MESEDMAPKPLHQSSSQIVWADITNALWVVHINNTILTTS